MEIPTLLIKQSVGAQIISAVNLGEDVTGSLKGTKLASDQFQALSDFYLSTDGPNWATSDGSAITGWTIDPATGANVGEDPCLGGGGWGWRGVSCMDGNIVTLTLEAFGLSGTLPANIGDMSSLKKLYLSYNSIGGDFPASVSQLTALTELDVSNNALTGAFPDICGMASPSDVRMSNNDLTGGVPDCLGNAAWTGLSILRLNGNGFDGQIPGSLVNLTGLTELDLSQNEFTGGFPAWVTSQPTLATVNLAGNRLSGAVPELTGNVQELIISDNQLSGDISASFNSLPELITLEAARNAFAPTFPSFNGTAKIEKIDLGGNALTAWAADSDFSLIPNLAVLNVESNGIGCVAGRPSCFPSGFESLAKLSAVHMRDNEIDGAAQLTLGAFITSGFQSKTLATLDVSNNRISSVMRATIHVWDNLQNFNIANNLLEGPVPSLPRSAVTVDFSGNRLTGNLKATLDDNVFLETFKALNNTGLEVDSPDGSLPSFIVPTDKFIVLPGTNYRCPEIRFVSNGALVDVDPSYYKYTLCTCQKGFYPDPFVPDCTAFPTYVPNTAPSGTITDGTSTGRVRDGLDTKYGITAAPGTRTIAIQVTRNALNATADGILNIHDGDSVLGTVVAQPRMADQGSTFYVFGREATIHFTSESDSGGVSMFSVDYTTSADCPPSYAFDDVAQKCALEACPPGEYFSRDGNNEKRCFPCTRNTYQPFANTGFSCTACPINSFTEDTGSTSIEECACGDGFVGDFSALGPPGAAVCKSCLGSQGAQCSGSTMTVERGYYKPPASFDVYECHPAGACKAGVGMGYLSTTVCKTGSTGPKCQVCLPGYFSIADTGCTKCGTKGGAITAIVFIILGVILLYSVLFYYDLANSSSAIKAIISFMQILYMQMMFQVSWPSVFKDFISIFGFIQLDFTDLAAPECSMDEEVDFFTTYGFYMAIIPCEIFVVAVHYLVYAFAYAPSKAASPEEAAQMKARFRSVCWANGLWITTLSFPSVAGNALRYFSCESIGGREFLKADYKIDCDSDYYKDKMSMAVIFAIIYCLAFPVGLLGFMLVHKMRKTAQIAKLEGSLPEAEDREAWRDQKRRHSDIETTVGAAKMTITVRSWNAFLTSDYTHDCFYWEIIDMYRKLAISAIAIFISAEHTGNLIASVFVGVLYLQSTVLFKPYKSSCDFYINVIGNFGIVVSLMAGLVIGSGAITSDAFGALAVANAVVHIATMVVTNVLNAYSLIPEGVDVNLYALVRERLTGRI